MIKRPQEPSFPLRDLPVFHPVLSLASRAENRGGLFRLVETGLLEEEEAWEALLR